MSEDGRWPKRNGSRRRPGDAVTTRNGIPVLGDADAPKEERLCKCGKEPALPGLPVGETCRKKRIDELNEQARARSAALGPPVEV